MLKFRQALQHYRWRNSGIKETAVLYASSNRWVSVILELWSSDLNITLMLNVLLYLLSVNESSFVGFHTVKWERYWNLAMLWYRPHVRAIRTSSKVFDSVRLPSIAVDGVSLNATEIY